MNPIYFPFNYVSRPVFEALSACFGQTAVYQITSQKIPEKMHELAKRETLEIRIPIEGDNEKLDAVMKDYMAWINTHQGSEIAFLKAQGDTTPFFDETSVSQIRADIRKKGQEDLSPKKTDDLFNAVIFIHVAQEFDMQNDGVSQDLQLLEEMEQNLLKNLRGENEASYDNIFGNKILEPYDPGHYMTKERIDAWIRLMQYDHEITGLFITSSRPVLEYMIDDVPEAEILIRLDDIPILENNIKEMEIWQDSLMESLDMLAKNAWPTSTDTILKAPVVTGCDKKVTLTLYIVPGETPQEFFARFYERDSFRTKDKNKEAEFKNTLIGLLEIWQPLKKSLF